jgi:hypothetical protein
VISVQKTGAIPTAARTNGRSLPPTRVLFPLTTWGHSLKVRSQMLFSIFHLFLAFFSTSSFGSDEVSEWYTIARCEQVSTKKGLRTNYSIAHCKLDQSNHAVVIETKSEGYQGEWLDLFSSGDSSSLKDCDKSRRKMASTLAIQTGLPVYALPAQSPDFARSCKKAGTLFSVSGATDQAQKKSSSRN